MLKQLLNQTVTQLLVVLLLVLQLLGILRQFVLLQKA